MPFRLKDSNVGADETFNLKGFNADNGAPHFSLTSALGGEIQVSYIPKVEDIWNPLDFDLFVLDNPYLGAENDVFEIYETSLEERIGWIYPITILVSNDNDFSESKNLNKYKFVSQYKLLNENETTIEINSVSDKILITDIYDEASIICICNKHTTSKIPNFNINDYVLSLYKYGYSFFQKSHNRKKILDKADFIDEMRSQNRRRVYIKKSLFDISTNNYISSLFTKHLLKTDDFLVRFIFLYQIIEQLMEDEFGILFQGFLDDFTKRNITKNDFKESINNSSKERGLIKTVFDKTHIENRLKNDFETCFSFLYTDLNYIVKGSLPDKIYDFRNLLTHGYRNLMEKVDYVNVLVQIFEDIIICALMNYKASGELENEKQLILNQYPNA